MLIWVAIERQTEGKSDIGLFRFDYQVWANEFKKLCGLLGVDPPYAMIAPVGPCFGIEMNAATEAIEKPRQHASICVGNFDCQLPPCGGLSISIGLPTLNEDAAFAINQPSRIT